MQLTLASKIKICDAIISHPLDDEKIMVNIETGHYFGVGRTARRIWELIETPVTVSALCDQLAEEFNGEREQIERDVIAFLQDLESEGLVSVNSQ